MFLIRQMNILMRARSYDILEGMVAQWGATGVLARLAAIKPVFVARRGDAAGFQVFLRARVWFEVVGVWRDLIFFFGMWCDIMWNDVMLRGVV